MSALRCFPHHVLLPTDARFVRNNLTFPPSTSAASLNNPLARQPLRTHTGMKTLKKKKAMICSSYVCSNNKTEAQSRKNPIDLHVHTLHACSRWLAQMEPRAADQIFARVIYPSLLKAGVLRNIVCACSIAMVILLAQFPRPH